MIARIAVYLPESLWVQESASFEPFSTEFNGERLLIYPPLQCPFELRPDNSGNFNVQDVYRLLTPVSEERIYRFVRLDGEYVKHANLLQIDFLQPAFDREAGRSGDPARDIIEAVVANVISRLRYTIAAPTFREFRLLDTFWTVRYLQDDGSELPETKGLVRGRVHAPFRFQFSGLCESSWDAVQRLTFDFQPHVWERLYLDALLLLPEVSPALTLAISAVETATDHMIRDRMPEDPRVPKVSLKSTGRLRGVSMTLPGDSSECHSAISQNSGQHLTGFGVPGMLRLTQASRFSMAWKSLTRWLRK